MVKNKTTAETEVKEEKTAEAPRKNYAGLAVRAFVWVIFLLVLLGLWFNPEVIYNSAQYFKAQQAPAEQTVSEQPSIKQLQGQIRELKNSVMNLGAAIGKYNRSDAVDTAMLDKLNGKFADLEAKNEEILNAKADSSVVLGLVERLDKIERRLDKVAKISDQGALILTTTMLIKDNAARGSSFEYEAEILKQLAAGDASLQQPVADILVFANKKIPLDRQLEKEFGEIYERIVKSEKDKQFQGKDWKERFNLKLNEYVKVKYTNEINSAEEAEAENDLERLKAVVDGGKFDLALEILNKPENQFVLTDYPSLKDWRDDVEARVKFYDAVSRISAQSLALMKLNFVKKDAVDE